MALSDSEYHAAAPVHDELQCTGMGRYNRKWPKARLYGPLEPWFNQSWRPGEIELVN